MGNKANTRNQIVGSKAYYFISSYPETIFDPRPYASYYLSRKLQIKADKPTIKVLFQTNIYSIEYRIKNIADYYDNGDERHNNYEHIDNICTNNQVCGTEVKICDNRISHILFDSVAEDCYYNQTYNIPLVWKGEERVADDRFIPLLTNNVGQIISYFFISENAVTIMLPQCKNKLQLLKKVFEEILFPHYSEYFPTIDAASWRNHTEYFLPNQQRLIQEKEDLKKQYEKYLIAIECEMKENEKRYSFLHTLLTGSGKPLVDAIIKYLNWLGFTNVIDLDTIKQDGDLLEEDIQIDMGDEGLLIIEVKGINGTSTDSECSQIHKIKFRRCEERRRFDVKALYIVNNERNIEPKKRTIPPFNDTQIKDAINDTNIKNKPYKTIVMKKIPKRESDKLITNNSFSKDISRNSIPNSLKSSFVKNENSNTIILKNKKDELFNKILQIQNGKSRNELFNESYHNSMISEGSECHINQKSFEIKNNKQNKDEINKNINLISKKNTMKLSHISPNNILGKEIQNLNLLNGKKNNSSSNMNSNIIKSNNSYKNNKFIKKKLTKNSSLYRSLKEKLKD